MLKTFLMQFQKKHLQAFQVLSFDNNPLHCDAEYARRTPFGQPVLFGMAGILYALGIGARGRALYLQKIQANFKKPLFLNEEYNLEISEPEPNVIRFQYCKGNIAYSSFQISYEVLPSDTIKKENNFDGHFQPLVKAKKNNQSISPTIEYGWNKKEKKLLEHFFLTEQQLSDAQWNALLGVSYLVGMEYPGEQALFSTLEINFEKGFENINRFSFNDIIFDYDERFYQVTINGKGNGIANFIISAFIRPQVKNFPIQEVYKQIQNQLQLSGKNILITGGSRGLGAVFTKACALANANVITTYLHSENEINHIQKELQQFDKPLLAYQINLIDEQAVQQVSKVIKNHTSELDYIIANAAPAARALSFQELTSNDFLSFLEQSMKIQFLTAKYFLPMIKKNGVFIAISSIYTKKVPKNFTHYVCAKTAFNGFVEALAKEHKSLRFVLALLPKILTDQTNVAFDMTSPANTINVAKKLLLQAADISDKNNFVILDNFE